MSGPLDGIRIVDLTSIVMGPFATQILGDLGADVIKIESPEGDALRRNGIARNPGMSALFMNSNRNKRSVVLDLKQSDSRDNLIDLVRGSDVFVHSIRAEAMKRLGIGYEVLCAANPQLVHCVISGYGESGICGGRAALDDLIQAAAGYCSLTAKVGGRPHYSPIFAARTSGLFVVHAVIAALIRRQRTGQGASIEVPMFETLAHLLLSDHMYGCTFDPPLAPPGYVRALVPERRPYTTKDGFICTNLYNDTHWRRFCDIVSRSELKTDPRFIDLPARTQNFQALCQFIVETLSERTTAEWFTILEKADIPSMPLHTLESLIDDEHLKAGGFINTAAHPSEGRIRTLGIPTLWSNSQPDVRRHAPRLGEHTAEVLGEIRSSHASMATDWRGRDDGKKLLSDAPEPLAGIRVIDLTSVVFGPYATQMLADLGADVIKVEPPSGEAFRYNGPARHRGMSAMYLHANRNKRSLVLNLKHSDGRAVLLRLLKTADVIVFNVRPRAMARLGLSYEEVVAVNPRIIYCSAVGYGEGGPYASKPAYDELIQGAVSLPSLEQRLTGRPQYIPMLISDRTAALTLIYSVLGAVYYRERSGHGQKIEVPMFETMAQMVLSDHLGGLAYEPACGEPGYQRALTPERRPFETSDGYISVSTIQDRHWRRFCDAIEHPEWKVDSRFFDQASRVLNTRELCESISSVLAQKTTADWMAQFDLSEVPASPVNTLDDLINDAHLKSCDFIQDREHPSEGAIRVLSYPVVWSDWRPARGHHAPGLGEHNQELLAELGYERSEIGKLVEAGATTHGQNL